MNLKKIYKALIFIILKMELTKNEKELIKFLVEKELKLTEEQEEEIRPEISFLAVEEKYEVLLEDLLKKLK